MMGQMDAKKRALDELMSYLDQNDGKELGAAMKPAPTEEVAAVEGEAPGGGEEMLEVGAEGGGKPEMSEEEMAELIEALQAKLG